MLINTEKHPMTSPFIFVPMSVPMAMASIFQHPQVQSKKGKLFRARMAWHGEGPSFLKKSSSQNMSKRSSSHCSLRTDAAFCADSDSMKFTKPMPARIMAMCPQSGPVNLGSSSISLGTKQLNTIQFSLAHLRSNIDPPCTKNGASKCHGESSPG